MSLIVCLSVCVYTYLNFCRPCAFLESPFYFVRLSIYLCCRVVFSLATLVANFFIKPMQVKLRRKHKHDCQNWVLFLMMGAFSGLLYDSRCHFCSFLGTFRYYLSQATVNIIDRLTHSSWKYARYLQAQAADPSGGLDRVCCQHPLLQDKQHPG